MSVSQFTAIYSPVVHGKLWSSKNTSRAMAIVVLGSFGIYSHLLFTPFRFTVDDIGREIHGTRYDPIWRTRLFDSICIVSQTVVCTILVLLTTWKIKKTATTDVKKALAEKSLLLVTVINIVFGCFSFLYGFMHLTNMAPDDDNVIFQFVGKQYLVYFFLLVNLNAFILPILSGTFREELWSRWFGKRNVVFVASTKM